ncbi:MAG: 50S ribosomal protein L6 [Methanoregulaceae archaeon]|nr:50S ribosomal protein L6 [Methanoregulaceae archaeon]
MTFTKKYRMPGGATCDLEGSKLKISGPKGKLERSVRYPRLVVVCDGQDVVISTESSRKEAVAMVGTLAAHVRNMSIGVTDGFEYRMKVVYAHFPIQLKLSGNTLEINNFLGEKKARHAKIEPGVTAKLGNDELTLSGVDKEAVGTTAANIEGATRIRNRDPRVFQDGIYKTLQG